MRSLIDGLNDHPLAMLRGIASLRAVALTSNSRADAAAQLAALMAEPVSTELALSGCSSDAQAAWNALQRAGGRLKAPMFFRSYGSIRPMGPGRLEREAPWLQPESAAEELWYQGLIFRSFADFGEGPTEYVYIPDELLLSASVVTLEVGVPPLVKVSPPRVALQTFNSLAVDVCNLLSVLRETPPRLGRAGLAREDSDNLLRHLLIPDATRLDLLLSLALGHDWIRFQGGRLAPEIPPFTAWLRESHWEQVTSLFRGWRQSGDAEPAMAGWNDLRRIPTMRAEGAWHNDPVMARNAILGYLVQLEPGSWYRLEDLTGWIKASNPDFQRPGGNYMEWYLRDTVSGRYLSGFESWDQVEGRMIHFLVKGPLYWLGAVAVGGPTPGEEGCFSVTKSGAAWFSGTAPAEFPRPQRLVVHDDFRVTAPLRLPLFDRFRLLRFSEPRDGPYRLGQPTEHRITRRSLARARTTGVSAEAVLRFLRRASGRNMPPRVVTALERWGEHRGSVRITRGAVVRVDHAAALSALRADPQLAPLLGELVSAQAVLVSNSNLPDLIKALETLGYEVIEEQRPSEPGKVP